MADTRRMEGQRALVTGSDTGIGRGVTLEMAPKGIRVNAIAPGAILVENHLKVLVNYDEAASARAIPAGFVGKPRDVGRLAIFLTSDDAAYIVGQTLNFDGGQGALMPLTGDFREPRKEQWGRGYVPGL